MDRSLSCDLLRYSIFDPTGNITALVETPVAVSAQPAMAAALMRRHPEVEQVGFVRLFLPAGGEKADAELRMAGGEFCGNASMSTAALLLLRRGSDKGEEKQVFLRVSGAARPVEVSLRGTDDGAFLAGVRMPRALAAEARALSFENLRDTLFHVRMEGISHLIVTPESCFFSLKEQPERAEKAVRAWCGALSADSLGLMFLEDGFLTPLVFVPGSGTVFWEQSCASGSSAVGMALSVQKHAPVSLTLREPGGVLRVESDPKSGITRLYGETRLVYEQ